MNRPLKYVTEWNINHIMDIVFMARHHDSFMMIFKDSDLHRYADKLKGDKEVKTRRETGVPLDPQAFRPDALLVDREGQSFILETKIGPGLSSQAQHMELVVQTLVYANVFLSPSWPGATPWRTYPFLDYLYHSYWYVNRPYDGPCPGLREVHKAHFGLSTCLEEREFKKIPHVLFLLEQFNQQRLKDSCTTVREQDFDVFRECVGGVLPRSSRFRKHLEGLRTNWSLLRETRFFTMAVDPSALKSLVSECREFL